MGSIDVVSIDAMTPERLPLATMPRGLAPGAALVVLARPDAVLAAGLIGMPPGEAARIARFQRPHDRAARTAAHGLLRALLAPLLGRAPEDIRLERDPRGRPALPDADGLDLNLSHGGGWIAIGLARGGRIGLDVEDGASVGDWARILPVFAHPAERADLGTPPDPDAALRLWTLKEACLKASGEGFATPPAALRVGTGATPLTLAHAGLALTARAQRLADGAWLAVATADLDRPPHHVLVAG